MRPFEDRSIRRKLMRMSMVVSAAALLFSCAAFIGYELLVFKKSAAEHLSTDAEIVAIDVTSALLFHDADAAAESLAGLRVLPNVVTAAVYGPDGRLFARYLRSPDVAMAALPATLAMTDSTHRIQGDDLIVLRQVLSDGKPAGMVYILSDLKGIDERVQSYALIALAVLAASFAVALALSSMLERKISAPILSLAETTRTIAANGDYSVRAEIRSNDETGILGEAFNDMLQRIEEQNDTLQKSEGSFREVARERTLLLESTGEGIYAVDHHGRCTMANHVATALFGRTIGEVVGNNIHDLTHHHRADGSWYPLGDSPIYNAFTSGQQARVTDEVFWRKDGSSFPVEYIASPIVDDGVVRGAVVTFSDVSARRRMERRLEQMDRIDSLGRMAATIAHEFNNVLMGIHVFAETIRRQADGDTRLQRSATQILNSVGRGKAITQDILQMASGAEPAFQSIDMAEWLEQLVSEIQALVGAKVDVDLQAPPPGTLLARCDPTQMQQVLANMALNARDAMPDGGVLRIVARRGEECVQLLVEDNGCGINPETLPFVFEPLFTTKHSGTGLGLAVAQQIVVRNGGAISIESTPGQGTRFRIDLLEALPAVTSPGSAEESLPRGPAVRRVVIVEDDPIVASGLSLVLETEDVEVRVVGLGRDAVGAVAAFHPDAVVIDISLPDMSGTDVYKEIAAQWPDLGVIFSTGHAEESRVPQSDSRHVGFLRKPYTTEVLMAKLREVM